MQHLSLGFLALIFSVFLSEGGTRLQGLYIYIYIYIYIHTYTYTYIYIYTHIHIHTHALGFILESVISGIDIDRFRSFFLHQEQEEGYDAEEVQV